MKHTILIILLGILLPVAATRAQTASDTLMMDYLRATGIPVTGNNRVKLLTTGRDKFADLFDAIRRARHHVHLEYFNFRNDPIANALFDLLAQKVQEGVEVRALFDAFGNWSNIQPLKEKHSKAIRARGIELVKFDPITFPYVNHALHRDHRKIVVIDGRTGYTGGMNVADYYITGLPKIGAWHDIHVRIINPYFVPTKSIRTALKRALKRGVRVEIMIPSVSDVPFTPEAALYYVHKLMKRGAHIYLFNGGFHHAKVMTVYDCYCTVGTANLNSRGMRCDYETNAFIFAPRTTAALNALFERNRQNSTLLTPDIWKQRSGWKKFVGWFAHLFTPVL